VSGSLSRWIYLVGGLIILLGGVFLVLRHAVNDDGVPIARATGELFAPGAPHTVIAVWAHPDDEITAAGTLARLAHDGAKVTLVYLTHGEGAHFTGYSRDQLYALRPEEAKAAGKALGVGDVVVLDYGDGKLPAADAAKAKADLAALIAVRRPSTVFSFDDRVGYYGHPDHAQAGRWTAELVRAGLADPAYPVKRLYQATLPAPVIALARKYISAFRTHYPTDPARGLPAPTIAVPISSQADAKRAVLDAHKTQVKVIDDVQPYGRRLPAFLYYRLFDREYFTLAAGR
jgi:LmbE family N-acetylglucosaminyl deacetylase